MLHRILKGIDRHVSSIQGTRRIEIVKEETFYLTLLWPLSCVECSQCNVGWACLLKRTRAIRTHSTIHIQMHLRLCGIRDGFEKWCCIRTGGRRRHRQKGRGEREIRTGNSALLLLKRKKKQVRLTRWNHLNCSAAVVVLVDVLYVRSCSYWGMMSYVVGGP